MSYGITILNQDGRIQIDESYNNLYLTTTTEQSANVYASYPPTGYVNGDLVFGRAKSDGHLGKGTSGSNFTWYNEPPNVYVVSPLPFHRYDPPSSGYGYYLAKKYSGNITSQSGYGLEVYNTSSQVLYSATAKENNFKVLAAGVLPASRSGPLEVTFPPSGTWDLTKTYCLIDASYHYFDYGWLPANPPLWYNDIVVAYSESISGYRYEYTSGNNGKIHVCNKNETVVPSPTSENPLFINMTYLIVEII